MDASNSIITINTLPSRDLMNCVILPLSMLPPLMTAPPVPLGQRMVSLSQLPCPVFTNKQVIQAHSKQIKHNVGIGSLGVPIPGVHV
ncbi:hypothetical protein BLNAU_2462 [Blattamonas nauphoetae]|uniref:Uncharacterized protein n=1 Tax=Blattamonas nauphoetae TaxID=2049346 RepID=A0ABQ9YGB5_9EUKA|nr:hypothetical protein BLNAU_2462 [Blattamonas nauphoetae]